MSQKAFPEEFAWSLCITAPEFYLEKVFMVQNLSDKRENADRRERVVLNITIMLGRQAVIYSPQEPRHVM